MCFEGKVGALAQPGGASEDYLGLEICFVGLVVRGNYVWFMGLFIVVIFMGFGGAKRWEVKL